MKSATLAFKKKCGKDDGTEGRLREEPLQM